MITSFECVSNEGETIQRWKVIIPRIIEYKSHYEIRIEAKSGIMLIFGKTSQGGFVCAPDLGLGCHISDFKNKACNIDMLSEVFDEIDAITIAEALYVLYKRRILKALARYGG